MTWENFDPSNLRLDEPDELNITDEMITRPKLVLYRRIQATKYIKSGFDAKGNTINNSKAYMRRTIENAYDEFNDMSDKDKCFMNAVVRKYIQEQQAQKEII